LTSLFDILILDLNLVEMEEKMKEKNEEQQTIVPKYNYNLPTNLLFIEKLFICVFSSACSK